MAAPEVRPDIIDAPLLRVPFESLKRAAKERKAIVDEAAEAVTAAVTGAAAAGGGAEAGAGTSTAVIQLDALLERLQGLKRKLADVSAQEEGDADRCGGCVYGCEAGMRSCVGVHCAPTQPPNQPTHQHTLAHHTGCGCGWRTCCRWGSRRVRAWWRGTTGAASLGSSWTTCCARGTQQSQVRGGSGFEHQA
jgi:hypothetical protein